MARARDQTTQIYIKYKKNSLFHDLSTLSENEDLNSIIFKLFHFLNNVTGSYKGEDKYKQYLSVPFSNCFFFTHR